MPLEQGMQTYHWTRSCERQHHRATHYLPSDALKKWLVWEINYHTLTYIHVNSLGITYSNHGFTSFCFPRPQCLLLAWGPFQPPSKPVGMCTFGKFAEGLCAKVLDVLLDGLRDFEKDMIFEKYESIAVELIYDDNGKLWAWCFMMDTQNKRYQNTNIWNMAHFNKCWKPPTTSHNHHRPCSSVMKSQDLEVPKLHRVSRCKP